ncbi:hypothetical protein [Streptomyces longwoodensis]|uniref:hypothetical protein n=1 Tax=Streptomyces longwoodensis TaxID=68231 RepID=UPI0036E04A07
MLSLDELRQTSTGLLAASVLAPHAPLLAMAAEAEAQMHRYRARAAALGASETQTEEVLEQVTAKAEQLQRAGADVTPTDIADEAWRCLVLRTGGLPYLPFMAYAEGLLRRDTAEG